MKDVRVLLPTGDSPPSARLLYGVDVEGGLRLLAPSSIHCVVTSPPYWGLRDYGVEGQIGLEADSDDYVHRMVAVFHEVKRVLRDDGTLWLNLGDSYASTGGTGGAGQSRHWDGREKNTETQTLRRAPTGGIKTKDMVGIPWRVALALQADGWWLRNAIIWHKPNPMPSSVRDRFNTSYEHIFLFAKSERYYFDLDAVRVPHTYGEYGESGEFEPAQSWHEDPDVIRKMDQTEGQLGTMAGPPRRFGRSQFNPNGKNPGDMWSIPTQPFPGAHFAVWPSSIPERCIRAGTCAEGVCGDCGAPMEQWIGKWTYSCKCAYIQNPRGRAVVLDPFSGSGTTGRVALRLGRDYVGIDLNESYLPMAVSRVRDEPPPDAPQPPPAGSVLDIFSSEG